MTPHIVADIVELIEKALPRHLYALDMTTQQYRSILEKLSVADNESLFDDKKVAIRKAIVRYFHKTFQIIEIQITFDSFALKKHFIDPYKSEAYDRMLHQTNSTLIDIFERQEEFSPLPFLISIPPEIREPMLERFFAFNEPLDFARHTIRQQIDQIFHLDPRDIIFFLRGKISVRHYTPPKKLPEGSDKRFNGESAELMEELYKNYFPEGAWKHIEPILDELLEEKLNFGIIDNLTFSRTFIPVFRSMIEILLLDILKEEDRNRIEGLSGYVLRNNFHDLLLYTAKNLLQFVEKRDKNAEIFIKYFADEIIIDSNGNKIQKYAIVDTKQQKWNFSAVLSIIMQYKQVKLKIATQKETILTSENDLIQCQNELAAEKENKEAINEKIAEIQETVNETDTSIVQLKNKAGATPEEAVSIKSQINKLNNHQGELLDLKKKSLNHLELSKNKIANKVSELTRRQRKLDYEKKTLKNYIEQMASLFETYEMIAEALATVMTKR